MYPSHLVTIVKIWRPLSLLIVHESVTLRFCFKNFDFIFLSFYFFFQLCDAFFARNTYLILKLRYQTDFNFVGVASVFYCAILVLSNFTFSITNPHATALNVHDELCFSFYFRQNFSIIILHDGLFFKCILHLCVNVLCKL